LACALFLLICTNKWMEGRDAIPADPGVVDQRGGRGGAAAAAQQHQHQGYHQDSQQMSQASFSDAYKHPDYGLCTTHRYFMG
jgi:hypothetical protein